MKHSDKIIQSAQRTIDIESKAISGLRAQIDTSFAKAVETIFLSNGRLIVTGIGKSANIANKIVATMNSTGTPAVFMHAADAIHGDLGIVQKNDTVLAISHSGNTPEIKALLPLIKNMGNTLVGLTAKRDSYLGLQSDYVLCTDVEEEACPNNLAPTSSTTAQLVMGDAVAVALLELRDFSSADFARYHPGGSLGKRLYVTVGDLYAQNARPAVQADATIKEVIVEISSKRLGITAVLENEKLVGVITDGDLRRMMEREDDVLTAKARDIMTAGPKFVEPKMLAAEALGLMQGKNITQLVVVEDGNYKGIIHLHDILKEGII